MTLAFVAVSVATLFAFWRATRRQPQPVLLRVKR